MPSLGVLYMAAVLEREHLPVEVLPAHVRGMTVEQVVGHLKASQTDVLGVTVTTENRLDAFRLCRAAKRARPGMTVVVGGPHCHHTAHDTLTHIPEIDVVVRGEGEETLPELVRALEARGVLDRVAGISFRDPEGNVVDTPPRAPVADLDSLPMPARHLDDLKAYRFFMDVPGRGRLPAANLITSRGCPFNCNFCATPANWGRNVRGLSPERVIAELEHVIDRYGARAIWFFDDTFNYNPQRLERICRMMIERRLGVSWFAEVRVDILTQPLFELMVKAGLFHVGFGVETACERVARDIIHKKATLQQARNLIGWCNAARIIANPFFIFSHPTETLAEATETLEFARSLEGRAQCSIAILHVYPGTELCSRAVAEGKIPADFSWTSEHDPRILELPEAQGRIPLYLDRLSWFDLSTIIFQFNDSARRIALRTKIVKALKNLRSWRQFKIYFVMGLAFLKLKFSKRRRPSATSGGAAS